MSKPNSGILKNFILDDVTNWTFKKSLILIEIYNILYPVHLPSLLIPVSSAPQSFTLQSTSSTSLRAEWAELEFPNGMLLGYNVSCTAATVISLRFYTWETPVGSFQDTQLMC